jgi:AMIN domain
VCPARRPLCPKRQLPDSVWPRCLAVANWLLCVVALQINLSVLHAQSPPGPTVKLASVLSPKTGSSKVALVKSFRIVQEKGGPALEILSSRPLIPAIQLISDPLRLIIDLPNARLDTLDTKERRHEVNAGQITTLRANQFQENPPVVRLVLDLTAPRKYTFDSAGNRIVVHLGKNPGETSSSPFEQSVSPIEQSTAPSLAPSPKPMVLAVRAAGPLAIAEHSGSVGSSFTAGGDTAVLRLSSGGELHVCPGTTVSITASENQHNLLLGMSAGAIETHIMLDASIDLVMTPDFQIKLAGPGEFHYAFSTDNQGNTCVRTLPGNTAPAIVNEMLGDRIYPVKAVDQLVFRGGRIDRMDTNVPLECGCPPPRQALEWASADSPVQNDTPRAAGLLAVNMPPKMPISHPETGTGVSGTSTQPATPAAQENVYVQVSAPLVFNAADPPAAPLEAARALPPEQRSSPTNASLSALPPAGATRERETANENPPPHRGFFGKVGHFFAGMFR